jgi:long-subunit acyl-CoA synthetase (AMP-forming)
LKEEGLIEAIKTDSLLDKSGKCPLVGILSENRWEYIAAKLALVSDSVVFVPISKEAN